MFLLTSALTSFLAACRCKRSFTFSFYFYRSRQPGLSGGQYLTRRSVEQFEECSWGVAPGNAIVVSSAMSMKNREDTQQFLQLAVQRYGQQVASLPKHRTYILTSFLTNEGVRVKIDSISLGFTVLQMQLSMPCPSQSQLYWLSICPTGKFIFAKETQRI